MLNEVLIVKKRLYSSLEKNKKELSEYFGGSVDYFQKNISIMNHDCSVIMCEDLSSMERIWETALFPLNDIEENASPFEVYDYILNKTTILMNSQPVQDFEKAMFFLTSGFCLILVDGVDKALVVAAQNYAHRGVSEPSSEGNLRGSKEGFTDVGRKNMALVRRRIRSKNLIIDTMQLGEKTKTEISIYYHKDYCPKELVELVKERLNSIEIPMIFESGYLAPFIDVTKGSLFQAVSYTERADTFCAKICAGKVGIMVDGSPFAIIYPFLFHEHFSTNDDYVQRPYFASIIRILRYLSFIIAIALPGIYVAMSVYSPESLPEKLIFFIYSSKNSTPLPLFAEAIIIIIMLEIIKEAGLRLPSPIGHTVSFVAALIIGDAAINAGLIGSAILIVCAVSTISAFVVPSFYETIIIFKIIFLLLGQFGGMIGISFGIMVLFINIANVNAASYDYANIFEFGNNGLLRDGILRTSWRKINKRKVR